MTAVGLFDCALAATLGPHASLSSLHRERPRVPSARVYIKSTPDPVGLRTKRTPDPRG
jgi:hypothetical protein